MSLLSETEMPEHPELALRLTGLLVSKEALALVQVLALGLAFRLWDITRPFSGYHMWNEVYYATIARNFDHFGLLAPYNYNWVGGSALSPRYGPAPFVSWLVYASFKGFGTAEWAARLPILILGMVSLAVLYQIARELYGARIGLVAAFIAAVMPGVVFFSRQVALDGPMTTFGLASVWMLLRARRTRGTLPLLASAVLLSIAIFTKYTAVLFGPCLAWIWFTTLRRRPPSQRRALWIMGVFYAIIAILPAAAWMLHGFAASPAGEAGGRSAAYLDRSYEWSLATWNRALILTWPRLADQVGHIVWYPLALAVAVALGTRKIGSLIRPHVVVLLLILPWFAQLIYPYSWIGNDGYTYPALYGLAILASLLLTDALRRLRQVQDFSAQAVRTTFSLIAIVTCVSCLMDYTQTFRSWYSPNVATLQLPANAVTPGADPFASAKLVRTLNTDHKPVLADLPATLYYAQDNAWEGVATWWWWGLEGQYEQDQMVAAIKSQEYAYVVFTYQPPLPITEALTTSGYYRVGPAAWERTVTS